MAVLRHSAVGILIVMLLSAGIPNPNHNDANQDGRIDLADAIRHMAEFQRSSERPDIFADRTAKMISALRVLAGYNSQIRPANDTPTLTSPLLIDQLYLVSVNSSRLDGLSSYSIVTYHTDLFGSLVIAPQVPPPRSVFA